jgi:hypothetical protein
MEEALLVEFSDDQERTYAMIASTRATTQVSALHARVRTPRRNPHWKAVILPARFSYDGEA